MLFALLLTYTLNAHAEALKWSPLLTSIDVETAFTPAEVLITKVQPAKTPLILLNKSQHGFEYSILKLAALNHLLFATNASMFAKADQSTSVGYMRNFAHINNDQFNGHKSFFVFNPKKSGSPLAQIVDKDSAGWNKAILGYNTVIQGLRLAKRSGQNVWLGDDDAYINMSAVSVAKDGTVYFFFHAGEMKVKDFTAHLLTLGLNLRGIMYLDGGHHGALVYPEGAEVEGMSGYLFLPNVIGVQHAE